MEEEISDALKYKQANQKEGKSHVFYSDSQVGEDYLSSGGQQKLINPHLLCFLLTYLFFM